MRITSPPPTAMQHIAIEEALDGVPVARLELVRDAEYGGAPTP